MNEKRVVDVLAAHAEKLIGDPQPYLDASVLGEEQRALASLIRTATLLHESMKPVRPSPTFVRTLRGELVQAANSKIARTSRLRRGMMIGTAVVGSLVSLASVVTAIVLLIRRQHTHRAQAAHAPTA